MDIKAVYTLLSFEIKTQLKTKSFWLLAILPPLAFIAMFWVNTSNTAYNTIALVNKTDIPLSIESNNHLHVKDVNSIEENSAQEKPDAIISITQSGEHIVCSIKQYKTLFPENISYIQKNVKNSYIQFLLDQEYVSATSKSNTDIHFENCIMNVETSYLSSIATVIIVILYIVILQFSSSILRMIGKEKKNKISEVLLTALDEREIIIAKLCAGLIVALIQILFWLIGALIIAYVIDSIAETAIWDGIYSTMNTLSSVISIKLICSYLLITLIMFVGGYFLYATIFSIIGAVSNENTNTQQFSIIATLPLLLTFLYISKNLNNSNYIIDFLSIFPLSSPIALLATIPQNWSWTTILSSIGLLYISDLILIRITSQLYKRGSFSFKYFWNSKI